MDLEDAGAYAPMRLFTREEANALLPALRALLADVVAVHRRLLETTGDLANIERRRDRSNALQLARPLRELRERLGAEREEMRVALESITRQGIQIKRIQPALLDFPAWRDGRIVLLCWHEGEPAVDHWHDIESGFAGRQPL